MFKMGDTEELGWLEAKGDISMTTYRRTVIFLKKKYLLCMDINGKVHYNGCMRCQS